MNLILINTILLGHWLSDFVLQKNKKKKGRQKVVKHKNVKHLIPHTAYYSSILTALLYILQLLHIIAPIYFLSILLFFIVTYITHFLTDFIITKTNEKHLRKNKRHKYVVTIGLDQYIHYATLCLSIKLLFLIS